MSKNSFFSEGFLIGALSGLVLGIIFAPTSGEETRSKLFQMKQDNEDLINQTKDKTDKMINKTLDAIDTGFEKVTQMIDKNKQATKESTAKETPKPKKKSS